MSRVDDVKTKVSVPQYFYNIIVPQLGSYYADYPVNFDARPVVCCPLHDENTPSMRYYEETNSFYCFGCRAGGDIIQLHRLFTERQSGTKPSYKEAIDFLYSYFLEGNESAKSVLTPKKLKYKSKQSTNVQKLKYNGYREALNGQLLVDNSVPYKQKLMIWRAMDNIDILLEKEEVNAEEAVNYIQNVVRETIT